MYRAKKVKYLALSAPQRHPNFPAIPTVAEALNLPDFELKAWIAIFAPHGTPKAIIDKLNADVGRALNEPDVRERMINVGFDPWPGTSAELAKAIEDDSKLFSEIAKRENISLD